MSEVFQMEPGDGEDNSQEEEKLTFPRKQLTELVRWRGFEYCSLAVILLNFMFMVLETDKFASGGDVTSLHSVTVTFMVVFAFELSVRIFVDGRSFFRSQMNLMDFSIVIGDSFLELLSSVLQFRKPQWLTTLRIFRILRLLRLLRALRAHKELWLMLHGLIAACKTMFWATLMIVMIFLIFSIVAVQVMQPILVDLAAEPQGCEGCTDKFSSVLRSSMTWFDLLVNGEGWADLALPLIEYNFATMFIFMVAFISVNFGFLNLVLAVIVNAAAEAQNNDNALLLHQKKVEFELMKGKLLKCCSTLDADQSGCLSLEEMVDGFENNVAFAEILTSMDVAKDDITTVFSIIDEDGSGSASYMEFVDQIHKMKSQEAHTMLVFIRHHINEIRNKVSEQLELQRKEQVFDRRQTETILETIREEICLVRLQITKEDDIQRTPGGGMDGHMHAAPANSLRGTSCTLQVAAPAGMTPDVVPSCVPTFRDQLVHLFQHFDDHLESIVRNTTLSCRAGASQQHMHLASATAHASPSPGIICTVGGEVPNCIPIFRNKLLFFFQDVDDYLDSEVRDAAKILGSVGTSDLPDLPPTIDAITCPRPQAPTMWDTPTRWQGLGRGCWSCGGQDYSICVCEGKGGSSSSMIPGSSQLGRLTCENNACESFGKTSGAYADRAVLPRICPHEARVLPTPGQGTSSSS